MSKLSLLAGLLLSLLSQSAFSQESSIEGIWVEMQNSASDIKWYFDDKGNFIYSNTCVAYFNGIFSIIDYGTYNYSPKKDSLILTITKEVKINNKEYATLNVTTKRAYKIISMDEDEIKLFFSSKPEKNDSPIPAIYVESSFVLQKQK